MDVLYVDCFKSVGSRYPDLQQTRITGKTAEIRERPKNNRKVLMDASANFENIH